MQQIISVKSPCWEPSYVQETHFIWSSRELSKYQSTDFSVWCSWVTWYWVGVSLSLSSLLSNSLLGLMDFRMSGILKFEIDSTQQLSILIKTLHTCDYLGAAFSVCLWWLDCDVIRLLIGLSGSIKLSDWSDLMSIEMSLCNEWMFSKSLWPSKCHNKPMNLLNFTLRLFHWECLNSIQITLKFKARSMNKFKTNPSESE